ncbi:MAG: CDP-alcohol phosphatidyltransferase family protein, partial [Pseudomonadota bacterium]
MSRSGPRAGEPAVSNLRNELTNLPNLITIGRVLLVPFVLILIDNYNPLRTFLASLLYIGAAGGDALDGYLARKRNQVSTLGKFLDPLADKLIVTAVLV